MTYQRCESSVRLPAIQHSLKAADRTGEEQDWIAVAKSETQLILDGIGYLSRLGLCHADRTRIRGFYLPKPWPGIRRMISPRAVSTARK